MTKSMNKTAIKIDYASFKFPGASPMVCLTAYTKPMAEMLDAHADLLLVGDSLAMVLYGHDSTRDIDVDTMIRHGQAVVKGADTAVVIVDMPYGSYEQDKQQAFDNAKRIMDETGCDGVKLEGGVDMAPTIEFLTTQGIHVIGHIGLMPQRVFGAFKARGRNEDDEKQILDDAHAVQAAGADAIVLEAVMEDLANEITREIDVPIIGIGASAACDGQILVSEDMLGLSTGRTPKFVHQFANLNEQIAAAAEHYAHDVRHRSFPTKANVYGRQQTSKKTSNQPK